MVVVWKVAILVGVWGAFVLHLAGGASEIQMPARVDSVQVYTFHRALDEPLRSKVAACLERGLAAPDGRRCLSLERG